MTADLRDRAARVKDALEIAAALDWHPREVVFAKGDGGVYAYGVDAIAVALSGYKDGWRVAAFVLGLPDEKVRKVMTHCLVMWRRSPPADPLRALRLALRPLVVGGAS